MRAGRILRSSAVVIAVMALAMAGPQGAWGAPVAYRQLDGAGLIGVLPAPGEAPPWFGTPRSLEAKSAVPDGPMAVCYVNADEPVKGKQASLVAYTFTEYGTLAIGYWNLISRVYQFPSKAAADAAWAELLARSPQCAGTWTVPYQFANTGRLGDIVLTQRVYPGSVQDGSRALVIASQSRGTRFGARAPERTGGSLKVWRHQGNVLFNVEFTKSVLDNVKSAVSASDQATVQAMSLLIGERYRAAAAITE